MAAREKDLHEHIKLLAKQYILELTKLGNHCQDIKYI